MDAVALVHPPPGPHMSTCPYGSYGVGVRCGLLRLPALAVDPAPQHTTAASTRSSSRRGDRSGMSAAVTAAVAGWWSVEVGAADGGEGDGGHQQREGDQQQRPGGHGG